MTFEDIGIAQPQTILVLQHYHDQWTMTLKKEGLKDKESYRSPTASRFVIEALEWCALAHKTRMADSVYWYSVLTHPYQELINLPKTLILPELPVKIKVPEL